MLRVFGIKQCDTCGTALKWLQARGIAHQFHDIRTQGLERALVSEWLASGFSGSLLNRRSTTWRGLSKELKNAQGPDLVQLLIDHPTLIKRPVFVDGEVIAVGFAPDKLAAVLRTAPS